MKITYTYSSNKLPSKLNNGDACGVFTIDKYKLFLVADGVSGCVGDYKASKTVVETFKDFFTKNIDSNNITEIVSRALEFTNKTILLEEGFYKGMKSTLVLSVIDTENRKHYFVGIGDSRIYKISNDKFEVLTKDEDKTIVRRKKDGTPITISGVIVNATGVTNVLGTSNFKYEIFEQDIEQSQSFLLATDGFYSNLVSDLSEVNQVAKSLDFKTEFNNLANKIKETQKDDATAIFYRIQLPEERNKLTKEQEISKKLLESIKDNNEEETEICLHFIEENNVKQSFEFYDNTIKLLFNSKINNSDIYQRLVTLLKQSK